MEREPKSVRAIVHDAVLGQGLGLTEEQARKITHEIIAGLSARLGDGSLRSEVKVIEHEHTQTQKIYVPHEIVKERHRRCWTEKERAFKLAMMRIHASGKKPTKTRILTELGKKRYRPWYAKPGDPGMFQLNGRQSAWQREMYQQLGYRMEGQYWVHERDKPVDIDETIERTTRTTRTVK
jgi:hypothetical protein